MTVIEEVDKFAKFAAERLNNGGASLTFKELVQEWLERQEYEETVNSVKRSLEDLEAGRAAPLDQAFENVRRRLGFDD